jgi:hypothetical protein
MADTWLTIEQAAVTLGLSVRTVNRHIVAGKIPSRLQDGRREVLVQTPADKSDAVSSGASVGSHAYDDSPFGAVLSPFASDTPSVTGPAISGHATVNIPPPQSHNDRNFDRPSDGSSDVPHHGTIDANTVLALADNANEKAELAVTAYQALARATDVQFQHVRRSARFAWAAVALMAVGVSVAVGWTTHHLTRAHVQTQFLQQQVQSKTGVADTLSAEQETLRAELSAAKEQAARAEGKASTLTDVQTRLEADLEDAQARASDAQTREARTRAEFEAQLDATRAASATPSAVPSTGASATTKPVGRPSDARADGQGG